MARLMSFLVVSIVLLYATVVTRARNIPMATPTATAATDNNQPKLAVVMLPPTTASGDAATADSKNFIAFGGVGGVAGVGGIVGLIPILPINNPAGSTSPLGGGGGLGPLGGGIPGVSNGIKSGVGSSGGFLGSHHHTGGLNPPRFP